MKIIILTKEEYEDFLHTTAWKHTDDMPSVFTKKSDFEDFTKSSSYDVGISFMWLHKVPAEQVRTHTWFNFHPGPLPEYKGRDLCYHAIMNGARSFGATLHYMDENFDTGDIIHVEMFPIFPWDTAESLSECTIKMAKSLFRHFFPKILETPVFPRIPNIGGTYYKKGKIIEEVPVRPEDPFGQFVRAVTYKQFYPKIDIAGVKYKIVREE